MLNILRDVMSGLRSAAAYPTLLIRRLGKGRVTRKTHFSGVYARLGSKEEEGKKQSRPRTVLGEGGGEEGEMRGETKGLTI